MPTTEENWEFLENLVLKEIDRENEKLAYWVEVLAEYGADLHKISEEELTSVPAHVEVNEKLIGTLTGIKTAVAAAEKSNNALLIAKHQLLELYNA
jgi:hypothetical protein